jgi:hypothetical protein
MSTYSRLALAIVAATICIGVSASAAIANRAILTTGGEVTAPTESMNFTSSEGAIRIRCPKTFTANIEREIPKRRGSHIGSASFAGTAGCRSELAEAVVRFLGEPWEMKYQSFSGTLPNIEGVLVQFVQLEFLIQIRILGITTLACLYRAEAEAQVILRSEEVDFLIESRARLVATLTGSCPELMLIEGHFAPLSRRQTMRLQ